MGHNFLQMERTLQGSEGFMFLSGGLFLIMAKRFLETTIWTQNKWFRKLKPEIKLFWFYLLSNCDTVGVWEEDIELASFVIGCELNIKEILDAFNNRIFVFNGKKWWIRDFCSFQYGELKESNITNKPHQSYIALLKKHSLWIEYAKTIHSLKDKDKEKDSSFIGNNNSYITDVSEKIVQHWEKWKNYRKKEFNFCFKSQDSEIETKKELLKLSDNNIELAMEIIDYTIACGYKAFVKPEKNKKHGQRSVTTPEERARAISEGLGLDGTRNSK